MSGIDFNIGKIVVIENSEESEVKNVDGTIQNINGILKSKGNAILVDNLEKTTSFNISTDGNLTASKSIIFTKTGSTTSAQTQASLSTSQEIGNIVFKSSDSTSFKDTVKILGATDGATQSNVNPGRLSLFTTEDSALLERMRINKKGYVSVGYDWANASLETSLPDNLFHLQDGNLNIRTNNSNVNQNSQIIFERSFNNTDGALDTTSKNDGILGSIIFKSQKDSASTGSNYINIASISSTLDKSGTLSTTNLPCSINFSTTPSGSATPKETMRLTSNGKLLFRNFTATDGHESWSDNFIPSNWSEKGGWLYSYLGEPFWQSDTQQTAFKIAGIDNTQNLTNKSFDDTTTSFFNTSNTGNNFRFECNLLSGSKTLTVPNEDGIIVTTVSRLSNLLLTDLGSTGKLSIKWNETDSDTTRTLNLQVNSGNRTLDLSKDLSITTDDEIKINNSNNSRLKLNHDLSGGIKKTIDDFDSNTNTDTTLANHLSTKAYIDREVSTAKQGLKVHEPCRVATTAALSATSTNIYSGTDTISITASTRTITLNSGNFANNPVQGEDIIIIGSNLTSNSDNSNRGIFEVESYNQTDKKIVIKVDTANNGQLPLIDETVSGVTIKKADLVANSNLVTVNTSEVTINSTNKTITLTTGSWTSQPNSNEIIEITGSSSNNGKFKVSQATSNVITVTIIETQLIDETATLTIHVVFSIDGVALSQNDRVLVKDQTDKTLNGIYNVSDIGSTSAGGKFVLVRHPDEDTPKELEGQIYTFVQVGTNNGGSSFVFTQPSTPILGEQLFDVKEFTKTGSIIAGNGISYDNSTSVISINTQTLNGLVFNSNKVAINAGAGLTIHSDNTLKLNLADSSVDSVLLSKSGGTGHGTYSVGDLLYASDTTTLNKLNIGSTNNVLIVNNNIPSWTSNINIYSGGTGLSSFSKGDMLYYDSGSTFTKLSAGGANKVLKMKGDGSVPEWGSVIDTVSSSTNDSGNKTLDMTSNKTFIISLSGNIVLGSPNTTGTLTGQSGSIVITTNNSSRTLNWGTNVGWYFEDGIPLTISNQNTVDVFNYIIVKDSQTASSRKILVTKASNFQHYN